LNIVHITSRKDWSEAMRAGQYIPASLKSDGFIHCSTFTQALPVAEKYYKGQSGLVLLVIDPARLASDLKWDPPSEGAPPPGVREGEVFPHIYGPINLDAIVQALDFAPGPQGDFVLPPGLLAGPNS
jgi:uncharacterized protein (DUF952 family)